jgi:hypothetical protein
MYQLERAAYAGLALAAILTLGGCNNSDIPTAASPTMAPAELETRFESQPQVTPVTSVPQARTYPPAKIAGEVTVCKDASSPAGTYKFTVSAANRHTGDLVADSVTLTPGTCAIVYNRVARAFGVSPFSDITIAEVVPAGATYNLDRILSNEDFVGPRTTSGPSVTVRANAHHGAYANFFNVSTLTTPPAPLVGLGTSSSYGILAGTTVTCVTGSIVNGDIGISPGSALTGFGPCTLSGTKNLANGVAAQAQLDLTAAYNTGAGLPCPGGNVLAADLGGTTKAAGVYCSASSIGLTGTLTLDGGGDPNATFVFQAGSTLTVAGNVVLINGAQAKNVTWIVGSSATLGTGSQFQGNILAFTSITLNDNVTLIGRALARNGAVTLGTSDVITLP